MPDDASSFDPRGFAGKARLFPLPNLVLFPHLVQPLHIFEPRYRDLMEAALAGDKLIAMSILAPGWESNYEGRPRLQPTACLGRIMTHHRLPDGRYNLLLLGLRRVRLVAELPAEHRYREALVQLLEDEYPAQAAAERPGLQRLLLDGFRRILPLLPDVQEQVEQFLATDVSLGILTDILAYSLPLSLDEKLQLLAEANVDQRAAYLADYLRRISDAHDKRPPLRHKYPPEFSQN